MLACFVDSDWAMPFDVSPSFHKTTYIPTLEPRKQLLQQPGDGERMSKSKCLASGRILRIQNQALRNNTTSHHSGLRRALISPSCSVFKQSQHVSNMFRV
jgi:hypothetical protein